MVTFIRPNVYSVVTSGETFQIAKCLFHNLISEQRVMLELDIFPIKWDGYLHSRQVFTFLRDRHFYKTSALTHTLKISWGRREWDNFGPWKVACEGWHQIWQRIQTNLKLSFPRRVFSSLKFSFLRYISVICFCQ